jgi:hypothetical protein
MVTSVLSLSPYFTSSTEVVRMRNALALNVGENPGFDWTPDSFPAEFLVERGPVDPLFADVALRLRLASLATDWERVTTISAHLFSAPAPLTGGAIQSDLRDTYRRIVERGEGYCGDFVRVFTAIALAAEMPVRWWAFSFDGFGGHGHIWLEVWNRDVKKWQLVDIFDNYYFAKADGAPLSALEFRAAMRDSPRSLSLLPLHPPARPGYAIPEKAWDYFSRGLPQWYLWLGNNVFTYDRAPLVRAFSRVSRSSEQLGAMLGSVYPGLQILVTPENRGEVDAIQGLRVHLLVAGSSAALGVTLWVVSMIGMRRARRKSVLVG